MREREESNKRAAEEKRAREEEKARKRKENLKQLGRHLGITLGAIFNIQLQGPVFVWPVTRFLFNMSMWVEEMLQHHALSTWDKHRPPAKMIPLWAVSNMLISNDNLLT